MAVTGINGINVQLQDFARFAEDKSVDKGKILRTDGSARVVIGSGDFIGNVLRFKANRDANNAVRASFLVAVHDLFGGEKNVPEDVLAALEMENFREQGKPLSVRRVRAVMASVTNQLTNLRAEARGLLDIALDRIHGGDSAFTAKFIDDFGGTEIVQHAINNGTPAELKSLIEGLRKQVMAFNLPSQAPVSANPQSDPIPEGSQDLKMQLDALPNVPGTVFNEEYGNRLTQGIYDPDTGRSYDFRQYGQGGARGNHCFFLSALHHLGITPSEKNARALRQYLQNFMETIVTNTRNNKGPVGHKAGDSGYMLDGNDISELFNMFRNGKVAFGKGSNLPADVSFGALLPSLLKRPVVMITTEDGTDGDFKTFTTDIRTGASYANETPVYIRYMPGENPRENGHFEALELVSVKEEDVAPKTEILNKIIPESLRNDSRGKALCQKIYQQLESLIQCSRGRRSNKYLLALIKTVAEDKEFLKQIQDQISIYAAVMAEGQTSLDPAVENDLDGKDDQDQNKKIKPSFAESLVEVGKVYNLEPPRR